VSHRRSSLSASTPAATRTGASRAPLDVVISDAARMFGSAGPDAIKKQLQSSVKAESDDSVVTDVGDAAVFNADSEAMKATILVILGAAAAAFAAEEKMPSADAVLRELKAGNDHHVSKKYTHPHQTEARQRELTSGQSPHAIILSCADSRVSPEIVLDQWLGDLFDIRVAGNVAGDSELASIEYAAEHLHTPLLVVMGHQKCGAVTAAADSGEAPGHLPPLLNMIKPAVAAARGKPGDLIDNAVRINVENVVQQVGASKPVLAGMVEHHELTVVGAVYSLDTGRVRWLPDAKK
jgi:carbonic anhydrase